MKTKDAISVAIATYNGEKYLKEQLDSILENLGENDEIVISDDGSTDNTIRIINSYNDKRIMLIEGPQKGLIKNFENAIKHCNKKYIFLSDQDDIWEKDKKEKVINCFINTNSILVIHDCVVFDSESNKTLIDSFFNYRKSKKGIIKNIIKNSYIGCCMAFDKSVVNKTIPFPDNIPMHDQWIGLISEKNGNVTFLNNKLIRYRRHSNNKTDLKHQGILRMLKNRISVIVNLIKR